MTEQEQRLERLIDYAAQRIVDAPTMGGKRLALSVLRKLKARRSPARVRELEAARWRRVNGL